MKFKRHWSYFKYLIRHKYYVFIAGWYLNVSIWRLLTHDISKFRPSEWFPYAETFYKEDGSNQYKPTEAFDKAWLYHQHRNPHHWQYWILRLDGGSIKYMSIPDKYVAEMVADWCGAGRAITGKWEVREWYDKNKDKIDVNGLTRNHINFYLNIWEYKISKRG